MALTDKNIVITPNSGQTANPQIVFSGADATTGPQSITIKVYPTDGGTLSFEGSAGQLFSLTNSLSGTIYSVNDVSGIPSIEVLDTGLVKLAEYGGNVLIGTGTDNGVDLLQIDGSITSTVLKSTVASGTPPLNVASTTLVTNLNADLLDGQQGSYYLDWTNVTNKPDPVVTVTLTGDVTGTANTTLTDLASGTISVATTIAANSVALGTDTTGNYVAGITAGTGITITGTAGEGWSPTVTVDGTSANTANKVVIRDASGNFSAGTITAALSGNASTATTLQTARTINNVSFNGSANITIPRLPTKGVLAAETLRAVHDTGIYTFNTNNASLGGSTPTGYWSTIAWGNGVNGSAQLAANWTSSGNELWFRSLRDTIDNWWEWKRIWHSGVTIPVASGGTGTTTSTGSGSVVLSTSPTLITPNIGVATGTSFNSITGLASVAPLVAGTAAVGTSTLVARQDHVHPVQTSVSGNAGTATTLQTARTINGVSFNGSANITVTANTTNTLTRGTYLTGNNFNGSAATTWAVDATTTNTASKVVARDASGNFSAGTITAALSGNASTATTLQTARTINGVSFNGSANIETSEWIHSLRDFTNGTLITTSINYAVTAGDPFVLEIRGNSYGSLIPFEIQYQGYIYTDTIINHGGYAVGTNITGLVALNVSGNLCFWFPNQAYWHGYNVRVYTAYEGRAANRVSSITNVAKPSGTKEVALSINIRQVLRSDNYNSYAPTLTGTGASGTWSINVTGNAGTAYGLNVHTGRNNEANKVVRTDSNGYIQAGWINTTSGDNGTTAIDRVYASSDGYIRYYTPANFRQVLNVPTRTGGDASGTWGINVTGNAGTASSTPNPTFSSGSVNKDDITTRTTSGFYQSNTATTAEGWPLNDNGWQHLLACTHSNDSNYYSMQIAASFYSQNWYFRNTNGSGTTGWSTMLHSGNYSFYALPLSGGTMSGSITSNAASLIIGTNGGSIRGYLYNDATGFGILSNSGNWAAYVALGTTNFYVTGSIVANGNVTAYSDERLKKDWHNLSTDFVSRLAKVKVGTFTRIDENLRQVGVSAQSLQALLPEAIHDDGKYLSVSYGNAALASAVELAKDNIELRARIEKLEALVEKLLAKE